MNRTLRMPTLPVVLDRTATGSLGGQLSGRIRELVVAGTLTRGDRLPSSRALAVDLGVSRSVTEQAYEQLLAEGWLETRRGSGTFVAAKSKVSRSAMATDGALTEARAWWAPVSDTAPRGWPVLARSL